MQWPLALCLDVPCPLSTRLRPLLCPLVLVVSQVRLCASWWSSVSASSAVGLSDTDEDGARGSESASLSGLQ